MRVLVAGGSGFVGRATVAALAAAGHEAVVLSRRPSSATSIAVDAGAGPIDLGSSGPFDACINLIGIARPRGANTYERAHAEAVRHLLEACRAAGVRRFVHVSVVRFEAPAGSPAAAYRTTKDAGEAWVDGSGLDWTIVRPGLVFGPGDDMTTSILDLVRRVPVFPVPRRSGALAPVDVADLAEVLVATLGDAGSVGRRIDVVGPASYSLSAVVRRVAAADGLSVRPVPVPNALLRAATWLLRWLPRPPMAPAQLGMLEAGLQGDSEEVAQRFGLRPRGLDEARLRATAASIPYPRLGLRWPGGRPPLAERQRAARATPHLAWYLPLALAAMLLSPRWLPDIWQRMSLVAPTLAVVALVAIPLPWSRLLRPRWRDLAWGSALAGAMVAGAWGFIALASRLAPAWMLDRTEVYAWGEAGDLGWLLGRLLLVVVAEDIVWRGAVTLPLAARTSAGLAALLAGGAFALAHVTSGPGVLVLAAWLAGSVWSLVAATRLGLVPVIVAHLLWDVAMVTLQP